MSVTPLPTASQRPARKSPLRAARLTTVSSSPDGDARAPAAPSPNASGLSCAR